MWEEKVEDGVRGVEGELRREGRLVCEGVCLWEFNSHLYTCRVEGSPPLLLLAVLSCAVKEVGERKLNLKSWACLHPPQLIFISWYDCVMLWRMKLSDWKPPTTMSEEGRT